MSEWEGQSGKYNDDIVLKTEWGELIEERDQLKKELSKSISISELEKLIKKWTKYSLKECRIDLQNLIDKGRGKDE